MLWETDKVELMEVGNNEEETAALVENKLEEDEDSDDGARQRSTWKRFWTWASAHDNHITLFEEKSCR